MKLKSPFETMKVHSQPQETEMRAYGTLSGVGMGKSKFNRVLEHEVQSADTLQGLALKYDSSMTEIKRINRLFSTESMFLKRTLFIPVMGDENVGVPLDTVYRPTSIKRGSKTLSPTNEMSTSISTDSGIVSHNDVSLTPLHGSRSELSFTSMQREVATASPTPSTSSLTRENPNYISANMHSEGYDDIFSRIDQNLKSTKKQMRKIGKQSVVTQPDVLCAMSNHGPMRQSSLASYTNGGYADLEFTPLPPDSNESGHRRNGSSPRIGYQVHFRNSNSHAQSYSSADNPSSTMVNSASQSRAPIVNGHHSYNGGSVQS